MMALCVIIRPESARKSLKSFSLVLLDNLRRVSKCSTAPSTELTASSHRPSGFSSTSTASVTTDSLLVILQLLLRLLLVVLLRLRHVAVRSVCPSSALIGGAIGMSFFGCGMPFIGGAIGMPFIGGAIGMPFIGGIDIPFVVVVVVVAVFVAVFVVVSFGSGGGDDIISSLDTVETFRTNLCTFESGAESCGALYANVASRL